jgi:isopentenyl diphosphate isomerase/L-lactate dehydrogenase-like FMN-dependent dehydrogenase
MHDADRQAFANFGDKPCEFESLHEIINEARQNLTHKAWDTLVGGAETETTLKRNRLAIDSIALRSRVLRDVSRVDASAEQFGRRLRLPLVLAPAGPLEMFGQGGGATVVTAAQAFGIAHMLSSGCTRLETVAAAAPHALRMAQLYVRGDDAFVDDYIARAIACGCAAFCLTVDTAVPGRRERDIAKRYRMGGLGRSRGMTFQAALDWHTVKRIKNKYDIPLVLKGIITVEDACIAVDHGVDWIYVSNHGGRQLDHGRGSMEALSEIVDAVAGRAKVMIDGSFCRGTDIVKAIAVGADLVGLGRMQCYALAAGGAAAIVRMLELIEDEVKQSLASLGINSFAEIDRSYIHTVAPITPPDVLSAFPLLKIEEYRH